MNNSIDKKTSCPEIIDTHDNRVKNNRVKNSIDNVATCTLNQLPLSNTKPEIARKIRANVIQILAAKLPKGEFSDEQRDDFLNRHLGQDQETFQLAGDSE